MEKFVARHATDIGDSVATFLPTPATMITNSMLQPGQDPNILLHAMDGARGRLPEHGEANTVLHPADVVPRGLLDEYEHVHNGYTPPTFELGDVGRTLRNIYVDSDSPLVLRNICQVCGLFASLLAVRNITHGPQCCHACAR